MNPLTDGYSMRPETESGNAKEYPFFVNLFPDLYVNVSGQFATAPFQLTLAANGTAGVPFILPKDGIFREYYFRFDVTDGNYSCFLTDISISLVHTSGGNRTAFLPEQLAVFCGTNSGMGQVRMPYIHPKEGSMLFRFTNLYPGTRCVSGWIQGFKVAK